MYPLKHFLINRRGGDCSGGGGERIRCHPRMDLSSPSEFRENIDLDLIPPPQGLFH